MIGLGKLKEAEKLLRDVVQATVELVGEGLGGKRDEEIGYNPLILKMKGKLAALLIKC